MGQMLRKKPLRLGEKLLRVRVHLGLSQSELINRLGFEGEVSAASVSLWEAGKREPPLGLLLAYGRAVKGVTVDALIDDALDLNLPRIKLPRSPDLKRKYSYRKSDN